MIEPERGKNPLVGFWLGPGALYQIKKKKKNTFHNILYTF